MRVRSPPPSPSPPRPRVFPPAVKPTISGYRERKRTTYSWCSFLSIYQTLRGDAFWKVYRTSSALSKAMKLHCVAWLSLFQDHFHCKLVHHCLSTELEALMLTFLLETSVLMSHWKCHYDERCWELVLPSCMEESEGSVKEYYIQMKFLSIKHYNSKFFNPWKVHKWNGKLLPTENSCATDQWYPGNNYCVEQLPKRAVGWLFAGDYWLSVYQVPVRLLLAICQLSVGCLTVDRLLAGCQLNVHCLSANCWPSLGQQLTYWGLSVGWLLATCWLSFERLLADCWLSVGCLWANC